MFIFLFYNMIQIKLAYLVVQDYNLSNFFLKIYLQHLNILVKKNVN